MHPAGTPKGQEQYYIYYTLERNICCCVEKEHVFGKTERIFGKKEKQVTKKSKHAGFLPKVKVFLCYRPSSW